MGGNLHLTHSEDKKNIIWSEVPWKKLKTVSSWFPVAPRLHWSVLAAGGRGSPAPVWADGVWWLEAPGEIRGVLPNWLSWKALIELSSTAEQHTTQSIWCLVILWEKKTPQRCGCSVKRTLWFTRGEKKKFFFHQLQIKQSHLRFTLAGTSVELHQKWTVKSWVSGHYSHYLLQQSGNITQSTSHSNVWPKLLKKRRRGTSVYAACNVMCSSSKACCSAQMFW